MQQKTQKFTPKENQYLVKVVVIGDINVGKTNIIKRIIGEDFSHTNATIGADFKYMNYQIKDLNNSSINYNIQIQIWDTCKIKIF